MSRVNGTNGAKLDIDHRLLPGSRAGRDDTQWCADIFNTDQGCQFTSQEYMGLLTQHHIAISMDAKTAGRITYSSNGSSNPLIRKEMGRD